MDTLDTATRTAFEKFSRLDSHVSGSSDKLTAVLAEILECDGTLSTQIATVHEQIDQLTQRVNDARDNSRQEREQILSFIDTIEGVLDDIRSNGGRMGVATTGQLKALIQSLQQTGSSVETVSSQAALRLRATIQKVEEAEKTVSSSFQNSVELVSDTANRVSDAITDLVDQMEELSEQLEGTLVAESNTKFTEVLGNYEQYSTELLEHFKQKWQVLKDDSNRLLEVVEGSIDEDVDSLQKDAEQLIGAIKETTATVSSGVETLLSVNSTVSSSVSTASVGLETVVGIMTELKSIFAKVG